MNLQEKMIKNTSLACNINEDIVQKIISHQWKSAKEATLIGSVIEISGLGRFQTRSPYVVRKKKMFTNFFDAAVRELGTLNKDTDERWYPTYKKVQNLQKDLDFLNTKKIVDKRKKDDTDN